VTGSGVGVPVSRTAIHSEAGATRKARVEFWADASEIPDSISIDARVLLPARSLTVTTTLPGSRAASSHPSGQPALVGVAPTISVLVGKLSAPDLGQREIAKVKIGNVLSALRGYGLDTPDGGGLHEFSL